VVRGVTLHLAIQDAKAAAAHRAARKQVRAAKAKEAKEAKEAKDAEEARKDALAQRCCCSVCAAIAFVILLIHHKRGGCGACREDASCSGLLFGECSCAANRTYMLGESCSCGAANCSCSDAGLVDEFCESTAMVLRAGLGFGFSDSHFAKDFALSTVPRKATLPGVWARETTLPVSFRKLHLGLRQRA